MASIDATRHVLRYRCENASGLVCESSFPLPAQPLAEGDAAESNVRDVFPMWRHESKPLPASSRRHRGTGGALFQGIFQGCTRCP